MADITFRPVAAADLPLLARWLKQRHVQRWWSPPDEALAEIELALSEPGVECFLVYVEGKAAGYLQSYDPHAEPRHPFADFPLGSRGLDMFIGEPDFLGRGYGMHIVRAFVERLFAAGVPSVLIDPEPDNARAVRIYEKAGFTADGERDTEWGRVLLMCQANPALSGNHAT